MEETRLLAELPLNIAIAQVRKATENNGTQYPVNASNPQMGDVSRVVLKTAIGTEPGAGHNTAHSAMFQPFFQGAYGVVRRDLASSHPDTGFAWHSATPLTVPVPSRHHGTQHGHRGRTAGDQHPDARWVRGNIEGADLARLRSRDPGTVCVHRQI